jgi:hypothetical protein
MERSTAVRSGDRVAEPDVPDVGPRGHRGGRLGRQPRPRSAAPIVVDSRRRSGSCGREHGLAAFPPAHRLGADHRHMVSRRRPIRRVLSREEKGEPQWP